MSRIRSKNTKPEMIVRKYLHGQGFRYRLHVKDLPGKPDIVLPRVKTAILVHGCFWHQHPGCSKASLPTSNREFWVDKLSRNVERDGEKKKQLVELGWKVIEIWECELKPKANFVSSDLLALLRESTDKKEIDDDGSPNAEPA